MLAFLSAAVLNSCANQLPPGGGEPDKIPPQIIDVYPANGTTNFKDDHIEMDLSEYVVKSSFRDAFFISPAIDGKIDFSWTGKGVSITFPEPLKKDVTYVITIGTDMVDYNNRNRMKETYSLTFSTGNEIDKRTISGKVYNDKPDGVFIFAYKEGNRKIIDPMNDKPDYISQTGIGGEYKIAGLAAGTYRLFAIRDQYKDYLFQPAQDEYSAPISDTRLSEGDSAVTGINFMITKRDTIPPRLLSATMTDRNHILAGFSKQLDSTVINRLNFLVYDSTAQKEINPYYVFKGTLKPTEAVIALTNEIPLQNQAYLFAKNLKDEYGNTFPEDVSGITISDREDTSKPGVINAIPSSGTTGADFINQSFVFYFSDGIDSALAGRGITFADTLGNNQEYKLSFIDDGTIKITPQNILGTSKDYRIKFDLSKFVDIAGNHFDSTYIYKFKTISGIDFTGLSGTLLNYEKNNNPILVLQGFDGRKMRYEQKPDDEGTFNLTRLAPGNYNLWLFYDENNNGKYDYGWPYPFQPAEKFFYYNSSLNLKPRWTLTDLKFDLSKIANN